MAAAVCSVAGLTAIYYAASIHGFAPNSDGATIVLQGSAMAHGNLGLSGWTLSLDSFWTVDAPFYAVAVLIDGLHPMLMHLVPALLAASAFAVSSWLCCRGRDRGERAVALSILVVLLALPAHALALFLLQGPWHVGTTLYCLVAFAALRHHRVGWRWGVAVVLLAGGLLGDFQMLAFSVIPVLLGGVVASLRCRNWRAGLPTAMAAPAALALAAIVRATVAALGAFRISSFHHTVSIHQLGRNIGNFVDWSAALFGVHAGPYGGPRLSGAIEVPHVLSMGAVAASVLVGAGALARGVWRGSDEIADGRDGWRIDDLLLLAFVCSVVTFALLTLSNNTLYARYLDPVVIFGAAYAARSIPKVIGHVARPGRLVAAVAWGAVAATSVIALATDLSTSPPIAPTAQLEQYLEQHHLTEGIGDYWAASIVTVDSGGALHVRPVVADLQGEISPDGRQAPTSWYQHQRFSFVVYERAPYGRVDAATVRHTFGAPAASRVIGRYTVDTFGHLLVLTTPPFPKPS